MIDRLLSLFTRVKHGEGAGALLLALNVFLLLASYYLLKTVREALILSEQGAVVKSYMSAAQAALLLGVIPAYGYFATRVDRIRLITWVTLFFILHLGIFWWLVTTGVKVGMAFFIWVGIFNVFIVAQFWGFANDIYTEEQGRRLFPIVGVGASLGAWLGAKLASEIFGKVDAKGLMLLAAGGLLMCIVLSRIVNRREHVAANPGRREIADEPLGKEGGFQLVMRNYYLRLIAAMIVLLNVVNTLGEFLFGKLVAEHAKQIAASQGGELDDIIGGIYGDFFSWVNLLGLLFQLFLVSRLFRWIGIRGTLFVLPLIALGSYSFMAALPLLAVVRIGKTVENAADYSIQNTTRHALFLPTTREAKYKAKAAIDSFFWRAGDLLQAGVVFAGTTWLAFGVRQFAVVNAVLVLIWLGVTYAIYREHQRLLPDENAEPVRKAA